MVICEGRRGLERCDSCQYIEGCFDIYCECELKKISHFPNIISAIFRSATFNQIIQEFPQIQEIPRISKVL